jgi:hypothetical protein
MGVGCGPEEEARRRERGRGQRRQRLLGFFVIPDTWKTEEDTLWGTSSVCLEVIVKLVIKMDDPDGVEKSS